MLTRAQEIFGGDQVDNLDLQALSNAGEVSICVIDGGKLVKIAAEGSNHPEIYIARLVGVADPNTHHQEGNVHHYQSLVFDENSHIGTVYVGSTPKTLDENKRPFVSGGSTTEEESLPQEVGGGDDDELSLLTEAPSIDSRSSRVSRPRKVKDKKGSSKRRGVSSSHTVESRGSRRSARLTRNRIVVETVDEANQS